MPELFVDISHWQGEPGLADSAFAQLKKCGVRAVIIKATQGTSWVDVSFATNLQRARKHGLLVGCYHFADGKPGKAQAQHFISTVRKINGGNLKDLLLVMDVERNPGAGGNAKAVTVRSFAKEVQRVARRNTLLCYTAAGYWSQIGNPDLADLFDGLWQARWDGQKHTCKASNLPAKPPRAGFGGWTTARFWQFGSYRFGTRKMDGNAFYGSLAKMRDLFETSAPVKPPPEPPPPPDSAAYRNDYNGWLAVLAGAVRTAGTPASDGGKEATEDVLAMIETLKIGEAS